MDHVHQALMFYDTVDVINLQKFKSCTVRPLYTNLQVLNIQRCKRAFACPITQVSSCIWHTLSCACILNRWLCFCGLYCIELYSSTVSLFQDQDVGAKHISSGNVAGIATSPCMPAVILYVLLNFSWYCTVIFKIFVFACFLCITYVKSIINLLQHSTIQLIVQVPRLTLLGSKKGTHSCVGNLLQSSGA